MQIGNQHHRAIEALPGSGRVRILDQTFLPHEVVWRDLSSAEEAAEAIKGMRVRGAPLIGATAAYGYAMALAEDPSDGNLASAYDTLHATRPTAVNLRWALDRIRSMAAPLAPDQRAPRAWTEALHIADEDVATNEAIGKHGLEVFQQAFVRRGGTGPLNIMTHCNAGWIATVDWGTALSPIYQAHQQGLPVHIWVSETRPRNQGAALTAWELSQHGIPHTLIVDNGAGHLLQRGLVDLVITGADRVTAAGDVANKIGTYLKALAAQAHGVPFYVAAPVSTIDWTIDDGIRDIPIEQRASREVTHVSGRGADASTAEVLITPDTTPARNDAFDVTPAGLVTGIITENGVFPATKEGLAPNAIKA